MHVTKANVNGNPNVGLFGFATPTAVLFGEKLRKKQLAHFEEVLGLPIVRCRIAGTTLPGVFLAGNKHATLVPGILFENEEAALEKHNVPFTIIKTDVTCLGNAIACNDKGAILSTEFTKDEAKLIGETLKVPVKQMAVAGLTTPGALIVTNGKHAIIHKDATDEEIMHVERHLGVTCEPATVNLGSPHLRSGILSSGHGFIIGDLSGGPEIVHIDEALGYHVVEE